MFELSDTRCCKGSGRGAAVGNGKICLHELKEGVEAVICHVPQRPLLFPLGFRPGKRIKFCTRECFGGPIIVNIEGRMVAVDRDVAAGIQLEGVR